MEKEIPKREGQKFNGTGVSVAALVFLLIGVPVASAYLIDFALYFGGEEIEYSSTDGPLASTFYPINTGSSDVALCSDNEVFNGTTCVGGQVGGIRYFKGEKYHVISGCENRTNIPNPYFNYSGASGFCGSDGYDYYISAKNLFNQNRTFPAINIEFVGGTSYVCDTNYFGKSLVDFKITFVRYSPTQFIPLPNGQMGPALYIENGTFSVNDVAKFDNGGTYDYQPTDMCNPTVSFTYSLSLTELNELEDFRKAYFETNTTFESIYIVLEMDNFRTESGAPYDYSNYYLPFQGAASDKNYAKLSVPTFEVDAVNFTLKVGVFGIGVGFWILALASTPMWNPVKERFA